MIILNVYEKKGVFQIVINKNIIKKISDKEMNRKDFLKYSGLAVLSLVGVGKVVSLLSQAGDQKSAAGSHDKKVARGFGGGAYGA